MRRETPEHRRRAALQRRLVRQRDRIGAKPLCLMERKSKHGWDQCGRIANQTVHIVRRPQCGEFWDAPEVAILGCEDCHKVYDRRFLGVAPFEVRVPFERAANAWVFLLEKVDSGEMVTKPYGRYNPFASDIYQDVVRRSS